MRRAALFVVFAASTLVTQAPALAQGPSPQAQAQARTSQAMAQRYDPGNDRGSTMDPLQCLIRKSDHKRICRSYDEWRAIALRMEREQSGKH